MKFNENWYFDQQIQELKVLCEQVKDLQGDVIEIGIWEGKSTFNIASTLTKDKLIAVDTWEGNIYENRKMQDSIKKIHPTLTALKERNVYEQWKENLQKYEEEFKINNIIEYRGDCFDFLKKYVNNSLNFPTHKKIKFIHIDADHHYDSVKRTIDLVKPLMIKGGIICGDDYGKLDKEGEQWFLDGGVKKAVNDSFNSFNVGYNDLWWKIIE